MTYGWSLTIPNSTKPLPCPRSGVLFPANWGSVSSICTSSPQFSSMLENSASVWGCLHMAKHGHRLHYVSLCIGLGKTSVCLSATILSLYDSPFNFFVYGFCLVTFFPFFFLFSCSWDFNVYLRAQWVLVESWEYQFYHWGLWWHLKVTQCNNCICCFFIGLLKNVGFQSIWISIATYCFLRIHWQGHGDIMERITTCCMSFHVSWVHYPERKKAHQFLP